MQKKERPQNVRETQETKKALITLEVRYVMSTREKRCCQPVEKKLEFLVPGGGVEPPRYQVPADFESAASASSAIPALRGSA